jgi:hypothetical protein
VGPPVEHRVAREDFLRDARRAGLALAAEHRFLPYQYFVVLSAAAGGARRRPPGPSARHPGRTGARPIHRRRRA